MNVLKKCVMKCMEVFGVTAILDGENIFLFFVLQHN